MAGKVVAVFGSSSSRTDPRLLAEAETLGEALARAGWIVLNGGYGATMEATARGAKKAGGQTAAVLLSLYGVTPNRWIDEPVVAKTIWERLELMMRRADAFIALEGSTGTLLEVAAVWENVHKNLMPNRPLILVGEFWRPLVGMFCPRSYSPACCKGSVVLAADAREAVCVLEILAPDRNAGRTINSKLEIRNSKSETNPKSKM